MKERLEKMLCLVGMRRCQTMPQKLEQKALPLQLQMFKKMQIKLHWRKSWQQKKQTRQKENWVSKDADTSTEFCITKWHLIDDRLSTATYKESRASGDEEEEEKVIKINISPSDAEESVQECWDEIVHFGNSELCIQLKEKESLTKRDQETFQIGVDIREDLNDAISHTIAKMVSVKRC